MQAQFLHELSNQLSCCNITAVSENRHNFTGAGNLLIFMKDVIDQFSKLFTPFGVYCFSMLASKNMIVECTSWNIKCFTMYLILTIK